jgi:peroxiredoxin Q/BCP
MRLQPGDTLPAFALPDQTGTVRRKSEFAGEHVILYAYPAAMTPGCTKQACDFRDNLKTLAREGFTVVGLSPDRPEKLAEFAKAERLPFTLLSDPDHAYMERIGAWGEKLLYGKTVTGVIRSTLVIDPKGKVEYAFYNVKATGHVAKLIRDLGL